MGGAAVGRARQRAVPLLEHPGQFGARGGQFGELTVRLVEQALACRPHAAARRTALCARVEEDGEILQREAKADGVANHHDVRERVVRVTAIAGCRPRRRWKSADPFVVPDGIGADARAGGGFLDREVVIAMRSIVNPRTIPGSTTRT